MRFDSVEFAGLDQGRDDGPVLCASVMSGEQSVFPVQSNGTDGVLDGIVVELDTTIADEQAQAVPVFGDVFQGFPGWGLSRDAGAALGEPNFKGIDDGFRAFLPRGAVLVGAQAAQVFFDAIERLDLYQAFLRDWGCAGLGNVMQFAARMSPAICQCHILRRRLSRRL